MVDAPPAPTELRVSRVAVKTARQRMKPKLSQRALARAARVSVEYVEALEQGKSPNATIGPLSRVASALGISIENLLEPVE